MEFVNGFIFCYSIVLLTAFVDSIHVIITERFHFNMPKYEWQLFKAYLVDNGMKLREFRKMPCRGQMLIFKDFYDTNQLC